MSKTITFVVRENVDLEKLKVAHDNGGPAEVLYQIRPASVESVTIDETED